MPININNQTPQFTSKQTLVVYQQFNAPRYPSVNGVLAPSTDTAWPTYSAGRILACYGSDAPKPELVGAYVNYDPSSTVASQTVPVAVLSAPFIQNLTGLDITSTATMTATLNRVEIAPLLIGTSLYKGALTNANEATIVLAFNASFDIASLGKVKNGMSDDEVITIQSTYKA